MIFLFHMYPVIAFLPLNKYIGMNCAQKTMFCIYWWSNVTHALELLYPYIHFKPPKTHVYCILSMTGCKLCDEYESNLTLASGSNSDMVEEPDPALKTQSVIKSFLPETELNGVLSSSKNAFGYFVKPVCPTFCNAHTSKFATERRQNLDRTQPSFLCVQDETLTLNLVPRWLKWLDAPESGLGKWLIEKTSSLTNER